MIYAFNLKHFFKKDSLRLNKTILEKKFGNLLHDLNAKQIN